ncbi:hypothetical protein [Ferrimicrobium sp.]|uniref:hypothetical protein n=1 Tax=Ferrimicrobium sp. TaxID=2926050 RepID=UPI002605CAC0|nr:hypothetical protein [Ferrimicrobium sp.]
MKWVAWNDLADATGVVELADVAEEVPQAASRLPPTTPKATMVKLQRINRDLKAPF